MDFDELEADEQAAEDETRLDDSRPLINTGNANILMDVGVPTKPLKLVSAVDTRWWARFAALKRIFKLKQAVTILLSEGIEGVE